jgi:hypothetical protein
MTPEELKLIMSQFTELKAQISGLEFQMHAGLEALEGRMNERFTSIDSVVSTILGRLDRLDRRFDRLDSRVDDFIEEVIELKRQLRKDAA